MSGGVVSGREALVRGILAAAWPDGSCDGFPSRRVAELIADALLASGAVREEAAVRAEALRDRAAALAPQDPA